MDIDSKLKSVESIFVSERGFGADTFEVYKFSLANPDKLTGFQDTNEEYKKRLAFYFYQTTEMEKEQRDSLNTSIEKIMQNEDAVYQFEETESTTKLYLYSPKLNVGYFFYLRI